MKRRLFVKGIISSIVLGVLYKVNSNFINQDEISLVRNKNNLPVATKRQVVINVESTGRRTKYGHGVVGLQAVEIVNGVVTGQHIDTLIDSDREIEACALRKVVDEDCLILSGVSTAFNDFIEGASVGIILKIPIHCYLANDGLRLNASEYLIADISHVVIDGFLLKSNTFENNLKMDLDLVRDNFNINTKDYSMYYRGGKLNSYQIVETYLAMNPLNKKT